MLLPKAHLSENAHVVLARPLRAHWHRGDGPERAVEVIVHAHFACFRWLPFDQGSNRWLVRANYNPN